MVKSLKISILSKYSTRYLNMISKANQKVKCFIMSVLQSDLFAMLNQPRKTFVANVLCQILSIKGKLNFLQLERYGTYCEQAYRNQYEKKFDFLTFNSLLADGVIAGQRAIAFDPSFIPKAGKGTYGKGKFWSGVSSACKWGLEIGGFAVVDVANNLALHLQAYQTPSSMELKEGNLTLLGHYASLVIKNAMQFKKISQYLLADAYFSKAPFLEAVLASGMQLISRLRDDSVLYYKYKGSLTRKKGAPKKYDGRVVAKHLNLTYFSMEQNGPGMQIYSAIVYSKAFKRDINLAVAVFFKDGAETKRKLYFSTDLTQTAADIVRYYRSRFQIEFLYRDAKQHAGLNDSQARSANKLDFHFNASLTAVNLAKKDWIETNDDKQKPFSMADYKTLYNNKLMIYLFIRKFAINPNTAKNRKRVQELLEYGKIAA